MSSDLVSIIVASYNAENTIHDMIDSVLDQTYTHWELLIVDDGSTDSTNKIISRYADNDNRIRLISSKNKGAVSARNLAYNMSKGDYICILDADDTLMKRKLEIQLSEFQRLPDKYGVVFSNTWYCDEKLNRYALDKDIYRYSYPNNGNYYRRLIMGGIFAVHAALIKKQYILGASIHPKEHEKLIPDWSLWIDLSTRCEFKYLPEAVCCYRQHDNMSAKSHGHKLQVQQRYNTANYIIKSKMFISLDNKTKGSFYFNNSRAFSKFGDYNLSMNWLFKSIKTWPFTLKFYFALLDLVIKKCKN